MTQTDANTGASDIVYDSMQAVLGTAPGYQCVPRLFPFIQQTVVAREWSTCQYWRPSASSACRRPA